jgi:hypothetical protein
VASGTWPVAHYAFHDLTLKVSHVEEESGRDLDQLLHDLLWVKTRASAGAPSLSLAVRLSDQGLTLPPTAREVLREDGLHGLESESDFYLTDGASLLHLEPRKGRGEARLAPSFFLKPSALREKFWAFGLLKLMRPMGIYALHAAGLVAESGLGVLVVGESGSGKSTLTIALIRGGWRYLSDEAVLLRSRPDGVEALAFRRHFYVDGAAAGDYADIPLGEERPDRRGGLRKRVAVEEVYPAQRVAACKPRVLLFPRIVRQTRSALVPLERASALGRLISQSGLQLLDRDTMAQHLTVLRTLLQQSTAYELQAGSDLYQDPMTLVDLLKGAEREELCPALS